jgi:hypothetical protein
VQPAHILYHVVYLGNPVFRHKFGEAGGQMVVFQDLLDQIAIKHGPRAGVGHARSPETFGQLLRHDMPAGASLPGNGHRAPFRGGQGRMRDGNGGTQLAVDEGQTMLQFRLGCHTTTEGHGFTSQCTRGGEEFNRAGTHFTAPNAASHGSLWLLDGEFIRLTIGGLWLN